MSGNSGPSTKHADQPSRAQSLNELLLCAECGHSRPEGPVLRDTDIARLKDALANVAKVRAVPCMNICDAPVTIALQGIGRATYLFKGVDPVTDEADLIATCKFFESEPNGWIEDARACGRLRHCLVGRVPALSQSAEQEPPR